MPAVPVDWLISPVVDWAVCLLNVTDCAAVLCFDYGKMWEVLKTSFLAPLFPNCCGFGKSPFTPDAATTGNFHLLPCWLLFKSCSHLGIRFLKNAGIKLSIYKRKDTAVRCTHFINTKVIND